MKMSLHSFEDWCHLCGRRSSPLADISYSENAEHRTDESRYIRICVACGERIMKINTFRAKESLDKLQRT